MSDQDTSCLMQLVEENGLPLNLYRLKRSDPAKHSEYISLVVAAPDEKTARDLRPAITWWIGNEGMAEVHYRNSGFNGTTNNWDCMLIGSAIACLTVGVLSYSYTGDE